MISGLLCISEKFRLASSSCPNPSFPNVSVLSVMFRFFRISPSFIFHFRFISGIFRRSYFIISGILCICEYSVLFPSRFPVHHCQMSEAFCFVCSLTSGNFRHSYLIISVSIPDYSVVIFSKISVLIFHHFRFISGLFRRHISGNFRPSYFIISASFPDYSVVIFPEISVFHISSFPLDFRITPSSYFRKFPSFIFHDFRFISGSFRCLVSGSFRPSYFIISVSFPDYSVVGRPRLF